MAQGVYRVREIGCGSLGLVWTASGGFDGYVDFTGRTKFFDVCAGMAILKSAGGTVEEVATKFEKKRLVGAGNRQTFDTIKRVLLS